MFCRSLFHILLCTYFCYIYQGWWRSSAEQDNSWSNRKCRLARRREAKAVFARRPRLRAATFRCLGEYKEMVRRSLRGISFNLTIYMLIVIEKIVKELFHILLSVLFIQLIHVIFFSLLQWYIGIVAVRPSSDRWSRRARAKWLAWRFICSRSRYNNTFLTSVLITMHIYLSQEIINHHA